MIEVTINGTTVSFEQASEGWINRTMAEPLSRGAQPCVRVTIDISGANFSLSTQGCGGGGPSSWRPNAKEQEIIDIWEAQHLGSTRVTPGAVIAFLHKLKRV
jgi:hypothetical protein